MAHGCTLHLCLMLQQTEKKEIYVINNILCLLPRTNFNQCLISPVVRCIFIWLVN